MTSSPNSQKPQHSAQLGRLYSCHICCTPDREYRSCMPRLADFQVPPLLPVQRTANLAGGKDFQAKLCMGQMNLDGGSDPACVYQVANPFFKSTFSQIQHCASFCSQRRSQPRRKESGLILLKLSASAQKPLAHRNGIELLPEGGAGGRHSSLRDSICPSLQFYSILFLFYSICPSLLF